MHVTINVKSPNNISEWQMGFNSAFKGLTMSLYGIRRLVLLVEVRCVLCEVGAEYLYL